MLKRMLGMVAATAVAANLAAAAGQNAASPCLPAFSAMTSTLPELTVRDDRHRWRGLPVSVTCEGNTVEGFAVEWTADASGLLLDARSAMASIGSRLSGDPASGIRSALDRCMARSERTGTEVELEFARVVLTCTVRPERAVLSLHRRRDR